MLCCAVLCCAKLTCRCCFIDASPCLAQLALTLQTDRWTQSTRACIVCCAVLCITHMQMPFIDASSCAAQLALPSSAPCVQLPAPRQYDAVICACTFNTLSTLPCIQLPAFREYDAVICACIFNILSAVVTNVLMSFLPLGATFRRHHTKCLACIDCIFASVFAVTESSVFLAGSHHTTTIILDREGYTEAQMSGQPIT